MLNKLSKTPLYLGLIIFVFSVLLASTKVGENQRIARLESQATQQEGASLSLKFTPPDLISVLLASDKDIKGADMVIIYDQKLIEVVPTSLFAGPSFSISGYLSSKTQGRFAFTVLADGQDQFTPSIVATFRIEPKVAPGQEVSLQFATVAGETQVFSEDLTKNILTQTEGITLTF